jgi:hypothetical protein
VTDTRTRRSIIDQLPSPDVLHHRLTDALREVVYLRSLIRLADRVAEYRRCDQAAAERGGDEHA